MEAGKTAVGGKWSIVDFKHEYKDAPVLFSTITTYLDKKALIIRHKYVSNTQFKVRLNAEEEIKSVNEVEEVSWVAFDVT